MIPKSIVIIGKTHFIKSKGSTVHSSIVLFDGVKVANVERTYGYENQYLYSSFQKLDELKLVPDYKNSPSEWCELNNVTLFYTSFEVSKPKDL
jgi:hypothetical protein